MNGRHDDHFLYVPSPHPDQDLRLHLDENISASVARLLRSSGFDITTTNDVGLRAKSDTSHMTYALEQQRIILTRDRDFLQLHDEDHAHCGIIYWPHTEYLSAGAMQDLLIRFLQRVAAAPTVLPSRIRAPNRQDAKSKRSDAGGPGRVKVRQSPTNCPPAFACRGSSTPDTNQPRKYSSKVAK